jgi:hypothetical protein
MLYLALYAVFGTLFVGGTIFYWISSRPFKWQDDFAQATRNVR